MKPIQEILASLYQTLKRVVVFFARFLFWLTWMNKISAKIELLQTIISWIFLQYFFSILHQIPIYNYTVCIWGTNQAKERHGNQIFWYNMKEIYWGYNLLHLSKNELGKHFSAFFFFSFNFLFKFWGTCAGCTGLLHR